MKKKNIRGYIILLILFIVFSVISFAVPFHKNTVVFWLAYIFGVIAIAFQIYVFKIAFSGEEVKSKFYGFPIARVGVIYLFSQIVVSIIEMAFATLIPVWILLILNVIIVALALVGCIAMDAVKEEIERQDTQITKDVSNMRKLQSLSNTLVGQSDAAIKQIIQDLANEFKYSDPVTCDQSISLENELLNMMVEMQKAIIDNDTESIKSLCKKTEGVLAERNRICKLNK